MSRQLESKLQQSCVKWFKHSFPNILIASFPNAGKRTHKTASRMKAEGLLAGMPDLIIARACNGYHGLFIEMKIGNETPEEKQQERINKLISEGYCVAVCYTFDEFRTIINKYFLL